MRDRDDGLCPRHPLRFPGGDAENYAAGWLRPICEMGLPCGPEISEGMPGDPERHRETDVPGVSGMERGKVKCVGWESLPIELPALRGKVGASQEEIASAVGISRQTYVNKSNSLACLRTLSLYFSSGFVFKTDRTT